MLRLVHERDIDEPDEGEPRRRARHEDAPPRPERFADYFYRRQRPSVLARVVHTLWLGVSFASVAFLAYLAGEASMFEPLFAPAPAPVAVTTQAPAPRPIVQAAPPPAAAQAPRTPTPSVPELVLLIRNAVVALHQANLTGDYAVLRALAAPEFQERNGASALGQAFAGLRAANLDLGQVAAVNPRLYVDPAIDGGGFLRLAGFIPLGEARADFEMAFQMVGGRWRLFGIGVHPPRGATAAVAKPASPTALPDNLVLLAMIRGAVLALNQANATGDYSVLRDLAASNFQKANSPAKLSEAFAAIRTRGLDLTPITVIDPRLFRPAAIDANGYLRLAGYFPSRPEQVNFDLVFQFEEGAWRLFGIGVDTSREDPATTALAP